MYNPPFPYIVKITRESANIDPFVSGSMIDIIYEGHCDKHVNSTPQIKGGVEYGRYKLFIPSVEQIFKKGDLIELDQQGSKIEGKVNDSDPTNMGTTIYWDVISN